MRSSSKLRRLAFLPVLAVLGIALSGCSDGANPPSVRVGEESLSKADLEELLTFNEQNSQLVAALQLGSAKNPNGAWKSAFVAQVLNTWMLGSAITDEFVAMKLAAVKSPPEELAQIQQAFGGEANWAKLPKALRDRESAFNAQVQAMIDKEALTLGSPQAFFEKNKSRFAGSTCSRHILVETAADAAAVKKRLADGESFADVAKSSSKDPGSGAQGGDLGCGDPAQFVQEFADAVRTQPLNEVGEPVQTQFGFHIIEVTKREAATFESAQADIQKALTDEASNVVRDRVFKRLNEAKITFDPSLATLDRSGPVPRFQPRV